MRDLMLKDERTTVGPFHLASHNGLVCALFMKSSCFSNCILTTSGRNEMFSDARLISDCSDVFGHGPMCSDVSECDRICSYSFGCPGQCLRSRVIPESQRIISEKPIKA